MNLKELFRKTNKRNILEEQGNTPEVPDGLFLKCEKCQSILSKDTLMANMYVCPKCGYHRTVSAYYRIKTMTDKSSFIEWDFNIENRNPLGIDGYEDKLRDIKGKTKLKEAVVSGYCKINGTPAVIAVMDSRFMMASMGYYVGEHITKTIEKATESALPLLIFTASGGARMQEGIVSLMQMAKTSAALKRHSKAGLLYITVLTNPTMGGVTASFAGLGDIIIAEPMALIGFAGQRVIENTIKQKLPEGFQRSEFQLKNGFVDRIVERKQLKHEIGRILELHQKNRKGKLKLKKSETNFDRLLNKNDKTPYEIVKLSRDSNRPVATDYIERLFPDFIELHGDRLFGDDEAVIGGIAEFKGIPVTVIAQAKGTDTENKIKRNFGMTSPHGYRKSLRLMKQAEKFNRPIICLVDTPGAFCGITAEEGGQGEAIARNLYEMSDIGVPILTIVLGEAGSGGALALAVSNEVWMLENSIYSILSPEGYASILWKDATRVKEAATEMKLTSKDLYNLKIIEDIIAEPSKYRREKIKLVSKIMERKIQKFLINYGEYDKEQLRNLRYDRFRKM